mmetsp:Transcript_17752/g.42244  ORF Transcript_17752/g.42244 Transcript_17752/m.42244 type:complete len:214 (+) Transcript_17752:289-930(+)
MRNPVSSSTSPHSERVRSCDTASLASAIASLLIPDGTPVPSVSRWREAASSHTEGSPPPGSCSPNDSTSSSDVNSSDVSPSSSLDNRCLCSMAGMGGGHCFHTPTLASVVDSRLPPWPPFTPLTSLPPFPRCAPPLKPLPLLNPLPPLLNTFPLLNAFPLLTFPLLKPLPLIDPLPLLNAFPLLNASGGKPPVSQGGGAIIRGGIIDAATAGP